MKQNQGPRRYRIGEYASYMGVTPDFLKHYEENRQYELTGKAMIVAYSRPIAMSIYHKILELRPEWNEKVKVVMTGSNKDPEEWHEIIGNKQYKKEGKSGDDRKQQGSGRMARDYRQQTI